MSIDSLARMEAASAAGTQAVIKSPDFDRPTLRTLRRDLGWKVVHLTAVRKLMKKKQIRKININHSQYQYWKMWR